MAVSGQGTAIFVAEYDLTTDFKEVGFDNMVKELDSTTFGGDAAPIEEAFMPSFASGKFSANGYWSQGTTPTPATDPTSVDYRLNQIFGLGNKPMTVGWQGTAIGNKGTLMRGFVAEWSIGAKVADLVAVNIAAKPGASSGVTMDGNVDYGWFIANKALRAATAGTTLLGIDTGTTLSLGFAAVIHVFALAGTIPGLTAKLQDSANSTNGTDGTWADVASGAFSGANAVGSEVIVQATSVRRWVRLSYTVTGSASPSFTFAVLFAKR